MTLELRVLTGARAGTRQSFDGDVIALGRHPSSDLRLDVAQDLDVSTRHAELRFTDGGWTLRDLGSTNGTFVNGERMSGTRSVGDRDVIGLGANGPTVEVCISVTDTTPVTRLTPGESVPAVPRASTPRRDTTARIAEAVQIESRNLSRRFVIALIAVLAIGCLAFLVWQRRSSSREQGLRALIAHSDSTLAEIQRTIADIRPRDSVYANALAARAAATREVAKAGRALIATPDAANDASIQQFRARLERATDAQEGIASMNIVKVHAANDGAVAMIASDLDGVFMAGTAFGVTPQGLLVTNKHVVRTEGGQPAARVRVIFANTSAWLPAHVVRMSDTDDLALLQLDVPGDYPVVAGVSRTGAQAQVGAPVASIGYPYAIDTPMEGTGLRITARSTTASGTVSKHIADVLQIDSYAGKGSSGSPVFDASGRVVGVIYGGAAESNGRIVYAVPANRLAGFLARDAGGILR